jgi:putative nucleotidyltransferase with HDIG domain
MNVRTDLYYCTYLDDYPDMRSIGSKRDKMFERLYRDAVEPACGRIIKYGLPYPKHEFLRYLTHTKGLLLHGSNVPDIEVLRPSKSNCKIKGFGNLVGVYAMRDEIFPIFQAIQDNDKFNGTTTLTGFTQSIDDNGVIHDIYQFAIESKLAKSKPWSKGMVYILPSDSFSQGVDDNGHQIDEWISSQPVMPIAKLPVSQRDFPYLKHITVISDEMMRVIKGDRGRSRCAGGVASWERTLEKKVRQDYRIPFSIIHPWVHTVNVVRNIKTIAKKVCPKHLKAAITAAYLHDIGRESDIGGTEHALRGARLAKKYYPSGLTALEKQTIEYAIAHHSDLSSPSGDYPVVANYPEINSRKLIEGIIASLWDADRIEMQRLGSVSEQFFSTEIAKKLMRKYKPDMIFMVKKRKK